MTADVINNTTNENDQVLGTAGMPTSSVQQVL